LWVFTLKVFLVRGGAVSTAGSAIRFTGSGSGVSAPASSPFKESNPRCFKVAYALCKFSDV
jgi:hypothetical protein